MLEKIKRRIGPLERLMIFWLVSSFLFIFAVPVPVHIFWITVMIILALISLGM